MAVTDRGNIRRLCTALLTGVAVCAIAIAPPTISYAQTPAPEVADGAKMLLRSNELTYNKDAQKVTATGGVQIYYNRYRMVAQRVEYDQATGRVMANGDIELIDPDGNRVYAEQLDVTDDFGQGFINSLRVETPDNTRMAGESAERLPGELMVLHNGVYTACLPCVAKPGKAPLWQVKAQRVIQNGEKKTIRLENARFELFGMPIGYLPFIEVPDHTVERKSGFLFPRMSMDDKLGFGLTVPYYHVFSPSMDATLSPTYYSSQGLLVQGEVRNRFETGSHILRFGWIDQKDSGGFDANTADSNNDQRLMVASKGEFQINPRWTFGWKAMLQSDNNFSNTYDLNGVNDDVYTNEVYLRGLGERNYFDLSAYYFDIQDLADNSDTERKQAIVYPSMDYRYIAPEPVAGGELSVNMNLTNISRRKDDFYLEPGSNVPRFRGLEGSYSRLTTEVEWKRTYNMENGLLITPLAALRGDIGRHTASSPTYYDAANPGGIAYNGNFDDSSSASRYMATLGLEARYPILMTTANSSHVLEPIAQLFVRNNEQKAGGLPNEDAQSMVYDASNLFERDKFSGYDRIEGGTRANVGVRYTGSFDNGIGLRGIFGQSYHLAGENSYASADLVSAGAYSGLESDTSDYVAMAAVDLPQGLTVAAQGRFDNNNFDLQRTDASVSYSQPRFSASMIYTQIEPQPDYGATKSGEYLQSAASVRVNENWSIAGTATWDLKDEEVIRRALGFTYADECTIFTVAYNDEPNSTTASDWAITARLTFRTLGDIEIGSTDLDDTN
ncbi:LPS-assembly protein LptD [Neorhizobium sp. JUb45]|uniref:LPS-assembly protein LptD n=1 Tax=unclassified Neorhizobium TaxID=2629175 RepID=UPI0010540195|nr:LPS-assembly protein LptD [Neorhizobium sp. JUb45]TCR04455.1 LPS-assembly protein [Neorhizobium sp. JUb45]